MHLVRVATAFCLIVAIPGLVYGFLLKVAPLGVPCDPDVATVMRLDEPTSGTACQTIDLTPLYWLIPAFVLMVLAAGIASARYRDRVDAVSHR